MLTIIKKLRMYFTGIIVQSRRPGTQRLHPEREVERGGRHLTVGILQQAVLQQALLEHEPRQRERRHGHSRALEQVHNLLKPTLLSTTGRLVSP